MAEEDEDYELVPHKVVSELKKEVDELKQNPFGSTSTGHDLQASMNALAHSINDLLTLFKDATDQMRMEEKDSHVFSKRIEPMIEKLDTIIEQNHTIAKGILAVAEMLKEHLKHRPKPPFPQQQNPFASSYGGPVPTVPRMPPPPQRPVYRPPFPEFNPLTETENPMPSPQAPPFGPPPMGGFNMPERTAPKSIPPAPPPPPSL